MVVLIVRNAGADLDRAGVNVAPIDQPAFLRGIVRSAAGEFWHAPIIAGLRDAFKRRPVLRQPDPAKNRTDGAAAVYAGGAAAATCDGAFFGRKLLPAQQPEWPSAHPSAFLLGRSRHKHEGRGAVQLR